MRDKLKQILIDKINKAYWWHVPPRDPDAYKKRGKFLASTYAQAEFYGKSNIEPERVNISKPIFGFSEKNILKQLFPKEHKNLALKDDDSYEASWYKKRIKLDNKMHKQAKNMGFDAIVLLSSKARKALEQNRKPGSIELNLLNL